MKIYYINRKERLVAQNPFLLNKEWERIPYRMNEEILREFLKTEKLMYISEEVLN